MDLSGCGFPRQLEEPAEVALALERCQSRPKVKVMKPLLEGQGSRILVVDDDAVVAKMFQRYFTSIGWVVDIATAFDEALAHVSRMAYALVLSDIRLSPRGRGEDGIELVRRLRAVSSSMAIIVLTAFADQQTTDTAMAAGADRVLQKPQPLSDLVHEISRLIKARTATAADSAT
jgi:CheY-like chemotaxis protein